MIGLIKVNMGTKYLIFKKIVTLFFAIPATEALVHGAEIDHGGWYVEMAGMGSTKRALPFWSHTNKGGVYPETCGGLFRGGVNGTSYGKTLSGWTGESGLPVMPPPRGMRRCITATEAAQEAWFRNSMSAPAGRN